jgi:hypothetical protein
VRLGFAHALAVLPLGLAGCLVTSSLDDLEGEGTTCEAATVDCDGLASNGCEHLETNPLHCGACNNVCPSAPSSSPACVAGSCTIACDVVAANCDGADANGCETAIETDADNCGGCAQVCGAANTESSACIAGACQLACLDGYASCDDAGANGCEAKLDEVDHCALCNRRCLSGPCESGDCVLSSLLDNATAIAATGSSVWISTTDASCTSSSCSYTRNFRSVPVAGGPVQTHFAPAEDVTDIAVSPDGTLYLATPSALLSVDPSAPSAPSTVAAQPADSVEVDDTYAYFHSREGILSNEVGIFRIPLAGGSSVKLAAAEQGFGFWGNEPRPLALGGGTLYYHAVAPTEGIHALPVAGGTPELVHATTIPRSIAADATAVYWIVEADPSVVHRARGGEVTELVTGQNGADQVLTDGQSLWWWNRGSGKLMRSGVDGAAVTTTFTASAVTPALLARDDSARYFVTPPGRLNRLSD